MWKYEIIEIECISVVDLNDKLDAFKADNYEIDYITTEYKVETFPIVYKISMKKEVDEVSVPLTE